MQKSEFRPVIYLKKSKTDHLLEVCTFVTLAFAWILALYTFKKSPEVVATHFDLHGNVDGYGSRFIFFIMPILSSLLAPLLFVINRYPHKFNYLETITPQNVEKLYRNGTRLIRILNLVLVLLLTSIQIFIIKSAITQNLSKFFLPVILSISVVMPIVMAVLLTRKAK